MEFLKDDLIRLRAVEPEDAEEMWEIETDSRQWYDNGMMAPLSLFNLRDYARRYDGNPFQAGQVRFIAQMLDSATEKYTTFGVLDIYDISPTRRTAFIGIYVKECFRGKRLASRALDIAEQYTGKLLNLRILGSKVSSKNKSSQALFESHGYELAGTLKDWLMSGNKMADLLIYTKPLSQLSASCNSD